MTNTEALEAVYERLMRRPNVRAYSKEHDANRADAFVVVFTPNCERSIERLNQRGHFSIERVPDGIHPRGRASLCCGVGVYSAAAIEDALVSVMQRGTEILIHRDDARCSTVS